MSKILPRYLYHMTSKSNYKEIKQSGFLKTVKPNLGEAPKGVYMLELTNFFKHWGKDFDGENPLQGLLSHVAKNTEDVVILKIPTNNINAEKLKIRSLNRLLSISKQNEKAQLEIASKCSNNRYNYVETELSKLDKNKLSPTEYRKVFESILAEAEKKFPLPENLGELCVPYSKEIIKGSSAKERKLFQQRKEAIEYIYPNDIPASSIEKIGEVNIDYNKLFSPEENIVKKVIHEIYSKLLKGNPEKNATILLEA